MKSVTSLSHKVLNGSSQALYATTLTLSSLACLFMSALYGSAPAAADSTLSSYQNPLRSAQSYSIGRIDQGVDYHFHNSNAQPIYAIGPGRIEGTVIGARAGWPGHVFIRYQLSSGAAKSAYIYVAEDCKPNSRLSFASGTPIDSNTVLCYAYNGGEGIEMGFAQDPHQVNGEDISMAYYEYVGHADGLATNFGRLFSHFLGAIGAPEGDISKSTGKGKIVLYSTPLPLAWSATLRSLLNNAASGFNSL